MTNFKDATGTTETGGLTADSNLMPLDQIVQNVLMAPMRDLFKACVMERRAHAETLQLVQKLKRKEIRIEQIVITDEGWQILPERPTSNNNSKAEVIADGKRPAEISAAR